jgi:tetratricopeptide (TPR) repeat protein
LFWPFRASAPSAQTTGDNSPAINAAGDVSVVQGYTAEKVAELIDHAVRSATESHAKELADLAAQLGATTEAVLNFLRILGERRVERDRLLETLSELGDKYRAAVERIASLEAVDANTKALLEQAQMANVAADYVTVDRLLAQAEANEIAAAEAARAAADSRFIRVAEVRASRGVVALAGLRFSEAATQFDSALVVLPQSEVDQRYTLLMLKAEALERHGAEKVDKDALLATIEIYDGIVFGGTAPQWLRRSALLALGRARTMLGTREADPKRLFEAIATFKLALKQYPRDEDPVNWAMIQMSIGNALSQIGRRADNSRALTDAVTAYTAALAALDTDKEPQRAALLLSNFAAALRTLGGRERGIATLEYAVLLNRLALRLFDRTKTPSSWATVKHNLGNLFNELATRRPGMSDLDAAEKCFRVALEERTRARAPVDWAETKNGLAMTLAYRGQRSQSQTLLGEAADTFREALEELTPERDPQSFVQAQTNLGSALAQRGELLGDDALLDEAIEAFTVARGAIARDRFPLLWASNEANLGTVLQNRGERAKDKLRVDSAVAALKGALEEWPLEKLPIQHATGQNNLGNALLASSRLGGGNEDARAAETALRVAMQVWDKAGMRRDAAGTRVNLATALIQLGKKNEASRLAGQAADLFRTEGMTPWVQRAEALKTSATGGVS